MIVLFALCAAGVSVDRFSNRLSIFNVLEQLSAPGFPIWVPELAFVVVLRRDDNDESRFQTQGQVQMGDNLIAETAVTVDFEGGNTTRQILNFQGLPVPSPGDLTFRFLLPGHDPAAVTIPVVRIGANAPQAPAEPAH